MGVNKIVKCRKEHTCAMCERTINVGEKAYYMELKTPKYDVEQVGASTYEKQIGVEYHKLYYCYDENTDLMPACWEENVDASDSNCAIHGVSVSCEHEERLMQGNGFTYSVCSKCGEDLS